MKKEKKKETAKCTAFIRTSQDCHSPHIPGCGNKVQMMFKKTKEERNELNVMTQTV